MRGTTDGWPTRASTSGTGDLSASFSATKKIEQAQEQAQNLHDYVHEIVAKAPPPIPSDAREQIAALLRPYGIEPDPAQMR